MITLIFCEKKCRQLQNRPFLLSSFLTNDSRIIRDSIRFDSRIMKIFNIVTSCYKNIEKTSAVLILHNLLPRICKIKTNATISWLSHKFCPSDPIVVRLTGEDNTFVCFTFRHFQLSIDFKYNSSR